MEGNTLLRKHQYEYQDNYIGQKIEQNKISNQMNALRCIRSKSEYLKEGIELLDNITAKLNEDMSYLEVMGLEKCC